MKSWMTQLRKEGEGERGAWSRILNEERRTRRRRMRRRWREGA